MAPADGKPVTSAAAGGRDARTVVAPVDGRQSEAALAIARGATRLLLAHGLVALPELVLPTGRRADLVALDDRGEIWLVEIKSSIEDFRSDQKWPEYRPFCDRLFFAVGPDFPLELIPEEAGLIVADRYGGAMLREAPFERMKPADRKAITLRAARVASARLNAIYDPEAAIEQSGVRD